MKAAKFFLALSISLPIVAQPGGQVFINAVVNQLLQVNQLRARNVIISGDLVVEGSIINGSGSSSGGSGSSGIQTIDGNSGSVTGTTVAIAGGNNITTSGSGTTLTVSVSGTTDNAVQIGNASGSLSSVDLGTAGEVLTSNGPGAAPAFAASSGIQMFFTDGGGIAIGPNVTLEVSNLSVDSPEGTAHFYGNDAHAISLSFTDQNSNVGIGTNALAAITSAQENVALGIGAGQAVTSGGGANTFLGSSAGGHITTGESNILVGEVAGTLYNSNESFNIGIGIKAGTVGDNNTIRIGSSIPGTYLSCFIDGIAGVTVANSSPVLINTTTHQLGTVVSSRRYKDDIKPMDISFSERIVQLQPSTFVYKKDETKTPSWGLVAEDVYEVFPELVVFSKDGLPETVKYHDLPVLLLNEVIQQKKEIIYLKSVIEKLLAQF